MFVLTCFSNVCCVSAYVGMSLMLVFLFTCFVLYVFVLLFSLIFWVGWLLHFCAFCCFVVLICVLMCFVCPDACVCSDVFFFLTSVVFLLMLVCL